VKRFDANIGFGTTVVIAAFSRRAPLQTRAYRAPS
jgi:hypothetical protein